MPKATNYPSVPLANASSFPTWQTAAGNHPLFPIACQQQSSRWQTASQSYSGSNVFGRTHRRAGLSLPVQRWPLVTQSLILDPYLPEPRLRPRKQSHTLSAPGEGGQAGWRVSACCWPCFGESDKCDFISKAHFTSTGLCVPRLSALTGTEGKERSMIVQKEMRSFAAANKIPIWVDLWGRIMIYPDVSSATAAPRIKNRIFAAEYAAASPRNPITFEIFIIYFCRNCESWWQDSEMLKNVTLNRNLSS